MCHHPPFRQPNNHQYIEQPSSVKHTLNLNHWVDVLHWWHRITLNELTSLQIEKRPSLRSGRQNDEDSAVEESVEYPSAHRMVRLSG